MPNWHNSQVESNSEKRNRFKPSNAYSFDIITFIRYLFWLSYSGMIVAHVWLKMAFSKGFAAGSQRTQRNVFNIPALTIN